MKDQSILNLAVRFQSVAYRASRIPGVPDATDLSLGANCQLYAYQILASMGYQLPDYRSSELWEDETFTFPVKDDFQPLDLMLYHRKAEAYGAHVGLYWDEGQVLHLSKANGTPKLEAHEALLQQEKYACFVGAKRLKAISSR
ncbi:MAG: NlpC/P60 family protein [Bacteroidota bacterium]